MASERTLLSVAALQGHGDVVTGLGWGPDGQALATACDDRTIRVYKLSGDLTSSSINFRRKIVTRGLVDVAFGQSEQQLLVLAKGAYDNTAAPRMKRRILLISALWCFGGAGWCLPMLFPRKWHRRLDFV